MNDRATVIAIGALAATMAAVLHETIGHGLGCIGVGGQIRLLTSIWFRCRGATSLTDAGGPIASALGGIAVLAILARTSPRPAARLLLLLFGALSMFWFASQLITHPLGNGDDWYFVARRMGWPPVWRPIMVACGVAAYAATMRWTRALSRRPGGPDGSAIAWAYAASAASAVIAGAMWHPQPLHSAIEGFKTLGVDPIGLLIATRWPIRDGQQPAATGPVMRSWTCIAIGAAVYLAFLLVQARGLGPWAMQPLRQ